MQRLNVLYMHAGANCFQEVFEKRGHIFHAIPLNKEFKNIPYYDFETGFDVNGILSDYGHIDIILASPDCRSYSPAGYNYYHRDPNNGYKTTVQHGINCDIFNQQLLRFIKSMQPKYYFIENPHGRLRQMPFMKGIPWYKITYCSYGDDRWKPTDIFTDHPNPAFKDPCPGRSADHVHATLCNSKKIKKSDRYKDAMDRSLIPTQLCEHIATLCEQGEIVMKKDKTIYNTTQLTPGYFFEKHVYHRDMFAHYLRWTYVLKNARIGQSILDFGCGTGEILEVFYRNRYKPKRYLGLDVREKTIMNNSEKFAKLDFAEFRQQDLCQLDLDLGETFDIITCFEVMEHIGHENADTFLDNIAYHCNKDTTVYLSTPNYDPQVGAANNHMLKKADGTVEVGEWDHFELEKKLSEFFVIEHKYGTFASQKDYKDDLHDWQIPMYEALKDYYDTNLIANIMAPLIPAEHARNCIWVMKVRED